jgi:hypothetical protein
VDVGAGAPKFVAVTPKADPNVVPPVDPNENPPAFPEPNVGCVVVVAGAVPPKLNDGAENPDINADVDAAAFTKTSSLASASSLPVESKVDAKSISLSSSSSFAAVCLPSVTVSKPKSRPERMHPPLTAASA